MKKKILVTFAAVVVTAFAGYGVSKSMNNSNAELSDLTLANIEALAQDEGGGSDSGCPSFISYKNDDYVIYENRKKRFLSSNCKTECGWTCRVRVSPIDYPDLPDIHL